jgi:hypothetical protein
MSPQLEGALAPDGFKADNVLKGLNETCAIFIWDLLFEARLNFIIGKQALLDLFAGILIAKPAIIQPPGNHARPDRVFQAKRLELIIQASLVYGLFGFDAKSVVFEPATAQDLPV